MSELNPFDSVGRDTKVVEMPGWTARDRQNFVRDTKDGWRVNVYWSYGGQWLIQAGRIKEDGDWRRFIGRHGQFIGAWCGWKRLATAKRWADVFSYMHDGWVGTTTYEVGN